MAETQGKDAGARDGEFRDGLPFFGGSLWLDLLNTTPVDGGIRQDLIATGEGYARWLAAARVSVDAAPIEIGELQAFRDILRGTVDLLRSRAPLPADVIAAVNARLRGTVVRFALVPDGPGLRLEETLDAGANGAAGIVAEDFARFVSDHEPERLKRCSNPACTMVFYDRGKNNARRWCTMSLCGNRDKVARYRSRHGAGAREPDL
jgi:predicted RNA-binding Zn ribbon-like protein